MTQNKATWKEKDLFDLHMLNYSPLWEDRMGTQTGGKPRVRIWWKGYGGEIFSDLILVVSSAFFLIEHWTTSQGAYTPIIGWALSCQLLIKNRTCPTILPVYSPKFQMHFINWVSLLLNDISYCQVDIKLARILPLPEAIKC